MNSDRKLDLLIAERVMGWNVKGFPPGRGMNACVVPYDIKVKSIPRYYRDIKRLKAYRRSK